jgi:hypothetical protein
MLIFKVDAIDHLVEEKRVIVQELNKILESYRDELGQMERLFTTSTPPFQNMSVISQEFPTRDDDHSISIDDIRNIHEALLPEVNFYVQFLRLC